MRYALLLLSITLLMPHQVTSQQPLPCHDISGRLVPYIANPSGQGDVAMAAFDSRGYPVIYVNPNIVNLSEPTRQFMYAHECGHHALGQVGGPITRVQEQQADCFGIVALVRQHLIDKDDFDVIVQEVAAYGRGDWTHLPGPPRAINLTACLKAKDLDFKTTDPDSDSASDTGSAPTPMSYADCRNNYNSCRSKLVTVDACLHDRVESCKRAFCTNKSWEACQNICGADQHTSWRDTCQETRTYGEQECRDDRKQCWADIAAASQKP